MLLFLLPFQRNNQAQSICFKIQCDQYLQTKAKDATGERAAGLQALASTLTGQGITVSNIVDYMSLIEQRSMQVRRRVTCSPKGVCAFQHDFQVEEGAGQELGEVDGYELEVEDPPRWSDVPSSRKTLDPNRWERWTG